MAAHVDESNPTTKGCMWIYISGPNAFIAAGEVACKERYRRGVDWYGAK
jgi:hypothetical protein